MRHWFLVLSGLLAASPASAAVFTVGSDGACTHGNLLSAISAASANGPGNDEIRLATNLTYNSIIAPVASHSITVRGGYTSCTDTTASGRTVIRGTTAGTNGTITTSGNATNYFLNLENLELRDGSNIARRGGALRIEGRFTVTLRNTEVTNNFAARGGGIYVDGIDSGGVVIDASSVVSSNTAGVSGGGIYCQNNGGVLLQGQVIANTAQDNGSDPNESGNGGGIALYGCLMNQEESPGFLGVLANTALRHGGGYYLRNSSRLFVTGNGTAPARIFGNIAGDTGGGIATNDQRFPPLTSDVEIENSSIEQNEAPTGAGIGLYQGGAVRMTRTLAAGACHNDTYCSTLSSNDYPSTATSGNGCAAYVGPGGWLRLQRTRVEDNCASGTGSPFHQRGGDARLHLLAAVVADNGGTNLFFLEPPYQGELDVAWSTITRNFDSLRAGVFSVPAGPTNNGSLRAWGSLLGEPAERIFTVSGIGGLPPMSFAFDCLVFDTAVTTDVVPYRSLKLAPPYGMTNPALGNYRLAAPTVVPVDWCDTSIAARLGGDAGGGSITYDAPIANQFGPYDIGAYEYVFVAQPDALFANGFE